MAPEMCASTVARVSTTPFFLIIFSADCLKRLMAVGGTESKSPIPLLCARSSYYFCGSRNIYSFTFNARSLVQLCLLILFLSLIKSGANP